MLLRLMLQMLGHSCFTYLHAPFKSKALLSFLFSLYAEFLSFFLNLSMYTRFI
jgi:Na+/H+ antiporter NhaB